VWFHADNLSSAHIYVRLPEGEDWGKMTRELLVDCAQLTKANSIEGNKKDNVTIVYTPWSNLKKDGSMAVGQVGFKDQRKVSSYVLRFWTCHMLIVEIFFFFGFTWFLMC
jgi:hypothetical protein